jgi:hypothetical protein
MSVFIDLKKQKSLSGLVLRLEGAGCGHQAGSKELAFDDVDKVARFRDGFLDRASGGGFARVFEFGEVAGGEDGCGDRDGLPACGGVHGFAPARMGSVAE